MVHSAFSVAPAPYARGADLRAGWTLALLFTFGLLALFLLAPSQLLQDPDTRWHVVVGQQIWTTGTLPHVEVLSHTFAGSPWIAKEWLSQMILFATYSAAGWWGLALLTAVVAAGSFGLLFGWLLGRLQPTAALVLAGLAVTLAAGQILARPHIFSFPILILWTGGLLGAAERGRAPSWWLVPLMVLWANLHASFPIGMAIAGIVALDAIAAAPAKARMALTIRWIGFGVASTFALVATPYGYEPLLIAFRLAGGDEALLYIAEWQPLGFGATAILPLAMAAASIVILLASPLRNLFRLLLVVFCAYMMVRHVRFTGLFGIVAAMVTATPLARLLPAAGSTGAMPRAGTAMRLALASLVAVCVVQAALVRPVPNPDMTPADALQAARAAGLSGPVYNEYDFGGYLIAEGVPTFIDGRSDQIFNGGFMTELNGPLAAGDDERFLSFIGRYGVTWSLVRPDSPERKIFAAAPGWREVYADEIASVYAKRSELPAAF